MQFLVSTFIDGALVVLKTERTQFQNHAKYVDSKVCVTETYRSEFFTLHIIVKRTISISVPANDNES